jgi:hypothetical protein
MTAARRMRAMDKAKIDANDLLKEWNAAGMEAQEQRAQIQGMAALAQPLIERMASEAGKLRQGVDDDETWSQEYEAAVEAVVALASGLDETTLGRYKNKLARKMRMPTRDFNNALAGKKRDGKAKQKDEQAVYIFGGDLIGDTLVEYTFDPESNVSKLAVRKLPDGKAEMVDQVVIDGVTYKPIPPIFDRMVTSGSVLFPSALAKERKSSREIASMVEKFLIKNYLFDDKKIPRVISYYVLLTWLYDNFRSIPYLRARGDAGSGKSELMKRVGLVCYRLTKTNGAGTMASFFRTTETFKGTVYFDEMDLANGSGADNEVVKFINLGAMDGNPVIRLEEVIKPDGSKGYQPTPFRSFCPKLFAMRKDFEDDAVGSRSISFRLIGKEAEEMMANGIPFEINDRMDKEARELRNLLLTWRMYEFKPGKRDLGNELVDTFVSSRMNQVTMPIKSLATDANGNIDTAFLAQVQALLRAIHAEQVQERSMSKTARVVEAIWKIYLYPDLRAKCLHAQPDGSIRIKVGDVQIVTNELIEEMNSDASIERQTNSEEEGAAKKFKPRHEIQARTIGNIIRDDLSLTMLDRTGKGFFFEWDDLKMNIYGRKYGVFDPENPETGKKITEAKAAVVKMLAGAAPKPVQNVMIEVETPEMPENPGVEDEIYEWK